MKPYIHTHAPKSLFEVKGQGSALEQLKDFVENFRGRKKKCLVLYGPSGVGKTSSVHALAQDLGMEVVEINASDFRNKDQINTIVGGALGQQSLFGGGKLVLVDEVDGLSGNKDRGGLPALIKLIQQSPFPVVLTLTNPYDKKFSSLRSKGELVEFTELAVDDIAAVLGQIALKENIAVDKESLTMLARRAGGDLRSAINNLQVASSLDASVSKAAIEELSERDQRDTIIMALNKILKSTNLEVAMTALDTVDEDLDEARLWLDENMPKEYSHPKDLARAYESISRADVFNGRIRRWQHYRFLVYIRAHLTGGIASAKDERYKQFTQYKPTGRILKMWWAKQKSMKKKAIAEKIAHATHTSTKRVLNDSFTYFNKLFNKNEQFAESAIEEYELDKEEVAWLRKQAV